MNHYHGTPIWGNAGEVHRIAVTGAGAFVSYARPEQLDRSLLLANSVGIDNGAFSAWKRHLQINWSDFYAWLEQYYFNDKTAFFVIPDVVEGGEEDNDALIAQMPSAFRAKATPVWHLHESLERLVSLCEDWPRVCFGSSGEYAQIRTARWHKRMASAFERIYLQHSFKTKIHGLRMLDGRVMGNYPLHSADSTNLASNVPKYLVKYPELTKAVLDAGYGIEQVKPHRCAILKGAIEAVKPPTIEQWLEARTSQPVQLEFLMDMAS